MSNKKNNLHKNKSKKSNAKKKQLLVEMQKDILDLEKQIKYAKLTNFKNGAIKNLRISARFGQRIAPYVLAAGVVAYGFELVGAGLPFIPNDEITYYSHIKGEFDNQGNIRYEQQYESFENGNNILSLYTKWVLQEDGLYSRTVKTFEIDNMSKEDILKLFNNPESINSLEDLFGKPSVSKREYKNKLDLPEEKNVDFLQAITYNKDMDDFIVVKESAEDNFWVSVIYILVTCIGEIISLAIRENISSFDFDDCVYNIKQKYNKVDVETLVKKLEIKRDNYNRLLK